LLDQLSLLGLALVFVLAHIGSAEQLTAAMQELPLPLAHQDRVDGVVVGDLLDRLATTDRLHTNSGLELGTDGAARAHWWEPLSGALLRLSGIDVACPGKPIHPSPGFSVIAQTVATYFSSTTEQPSQADHFGFVGPLSVFLFFRVSPSGDVTTCVTP